MPAKSQRITFPSAEGHALAANLELPAGPPRAYALFAHCFTCSKASRAATTVARSLAGHGIAVLRFDFTGLGSSEGDFANTGFTTNVEDLVAAADFLRDSFEAPKILIGHSLGGAAVLRAADRVAEAVAVATIGAPSDPHHVKHLFEDGLDEIEAEGSAEIDIGGRPVRIGAKFVKDIAGQPMREAIHDLNRALIVFHAPLDQIVGIENAAEIFLAAKHPKSFVSLDNADHLLTRREDGEYAAAVLSAWATRYMDEFDVAKPAPPPGLTRVSEAGTGKFTQDVWSDGHHLVADEPEAYGGDDTGPTPYGLLLAGLGACTTMTMRMYAERKGWPVDNLSVDLMHEKIHAKDCDDCETKDGKIDHIERVITITGDLDDEQHTRLMEIADKCPIHRTLHAEIKIDTRAAD